MLIRTPAPPRPAASTAELVSPAAPRSCIPTTASVFSSSRHASISSFSRNGFPTCTTPRVDASGSSTEANVAPCTPSRPVSAPTRISGLPVPVAVALVSRPCGRIPTHIAFTNGFPS